jgi:hypothetical protein
VSIGDYLDFAWLLCGAMATSYYIGHVRACPACGPALARGPQWQWLATIAVMMIGGLVSLGWVIMRVKTGPR